MPDLPEKYVSKAQDIRPEPPAGATIHVYAKDFPLESLKRPPHAQELISEWEIVAFWDTWDFLWMEEV